jgi:hypothetical protein
MPQALGSSGAHIGIGNALTFATVTFEAEFGLICVDAATPVTASAKMDARTIVFMADYP